MTGSLPVTNTIGTVVVTALATSADGVFPTTNQISDQDRQSVSSIFRRAIFDLDVLACNEACFPQALAERGRQMRGISERGTADESDHRHRRLLPARRERPRGRCTAEQRDELAALHSITSSASDSTLSENLTPSAFAVLRLITNSNLLDCMTGKSAGVAPLRILPA